MRTSKFFRFTIMGESLEFDKLNKVVTLPGEIFLKGQVNIKEYPTFMVKIPQKINRWVYYDNQIDDTSISKFLTKNLCLINSHLNELDYFIRNYQAKMELNIYAENKTDICLTKTQIKLLNKIGVKLYISFC